jgi:transcriptional regulator with XRE-family HTH domain
MSPRVRPQNARGKAVQPRRGGTPRGSRLPELQLGAHVRRLRRERGLTLQAVSSSTRLSPALLSLIENEQVIPPIATLLKIARFFNVPLSRFFEDHETGAISVVRRHERVPVNRRLARDGHAIGYRYFSLGYHKARKRMEPFLVEFDSKEKEDVLYFDHQGEALHVAALFCLLNVVCTEATLRLGLSFYGYGYGAACLGSMALGVYYLNERLRLLHYWTFMRQPLPTPVLVSEEREPEI